MFTVACSNKMAYQTEIWSGIKQSIIKVLNSINGTSLEKDVIFGLNIHNEQMRLKTSKLDTISSDIWTSWRDNIDMEEDSIEKTNHQALWSMLDK